MNITKIISVLVVGSLGLTETAMADDMHAMHNMSMPEAQSTNEPVTKTMAMPNMQHDEHEHGGEIYQATELDVMWQSDKNQTGTFASEFKSWVGTDENKLYLQGHSEKAESQDFAYSIAALYSRNIATFWDVQTGVHYQNEKLASTRQDRVDAVVGLHGLAPYFFETQAYLYVGQHGHVSLNFETERDFLWTQKLISQPYLKANLLLHDSQDTAPKTGLTLLQTGIQTRYEISKKVMPFIDVSYAYSRNHGAAENLDSLDSESGWLYGAGITFKF